MHVGLYLAGAATSPRGGDGNRDAIPAETSEALTAFL